MGVHKFVYKDTKPQCEFGISLQHSGEWAIQYRYLAFVEYLAKKLRVC